MLGLPRGGITVAFQVARAPGARWMSSWSVGSGCRSSRAWYGRARGGQDAGHQRRGHLRGGVSEDQAAAVQAREQAAVKARPARYRARRPRPSLGGRVAAVAGDGVASGSTARAACQIARAQGAARVMLAAPVAPGWQERIGADAGELVCVGPPRGFVAIGQFCAWFPPVSDEEVLACPERAAAPQSSAQASTAPAAGTADPPGRSEEVQPEAGVVRLAGS